MFRLLFYYFGVNMRTRTGTSRTGHQLERTDRIKYFLINLLLKINSGYIFFHCNYYRFKLIPQPESKAFLLQNIKGFTTKRDRKGILFNLEKTSLNTDGQASEKNNNKKIASETLLVYSEI